MSLSYQLAFATELVHTQVIERLLNGARTQVRAVTETVVVAKVPGFTIFVAAMSPRSQADQAETFKISLPTAGIDFQLDKFGDIAAATQRILQCVSELLLCEPGDAAFTWEYDLVLFVRRSGQLLIERNNDFWTPELLTMLGFPYTFADLSK